MMKKVLRYVFVLLVVAGATGIDAQFLRETIITYYLDDAFLDYAGSYEQYCDGSVYDTGTRGSWRVYDQYSCRTGYRVVHRCQQTDGMGGWITLTCPENQP